jgi:hypothetical protein
MKEQLPEEEKHRRHQELLAVVENFSLQKTASTVKNLVLR